MPYPIFIILPLGLFIVVRSARMRLVACGDELVVVNQTSTVRFQRSEVHSFRIGRGSGAGSKAIVVVPHEGVVVRVMASQQAFSRSNHRLMQQLEALRAWHAGRDSLGGKWLL